MRDGTGEETVSQTEGNGGDFKLYLRILLGWDAPVARGSCRGGSVGCIAQHKCISLSTARGQGVDNVARRFFF